MLTSDYVANFRAYERSLQTGPQNERVAHCANRLMDVLYPLVLELKPTRDEWAAMIEWVAGLDVIQGKLVLWLMGLTQLVEEGNANMSPEATQIGVEGPFHVPGAPEVAIGGMLPSSTDGDDDMLILEGHVRDLSGAPLAGVELDIWAANTHGHYSQFEESMEPWDCRGRVRTDANGHYSVKMAMPAPYGIPGAGAEFLAAMGRQPMRPRHVHFLIDHPGFEQLIMQVCFEGDDYVRTDAALAVREDHIIPIEKISDGAALAAHGMTKPFHRGTYDFRLQHVVAAKAA
jgi:protocatechuate 3,4-dioxygenase beta subunit